MSKTMAISDEARANRTAAGSRNLAAYKASRAASRQAMEHAASEFRAAIILALGATPTVVQAAGVTSAVTLYLGIVDAQARLLSAAAGQAKLNSLYARLPIMTGSLLRVLRSLGIDMRREDAAGETLESYITTKFCDKEPNAVDR